MLKHKCQMLWVVFVAVFMAIIVNCANTKNETNVLWDKIARSEMVENQIVARGISDTNVINAMLEVERHKFVPKDLETLAYNDYPLPIGEGQTISQPFVVALMTEKLELLSTDNVLEIGTGSGYQAAVLSLIANEIYTIEIIPSLADNAAKNLEKYGYSNVRVKCGDGFLGWPEVGPFDAIIITCATPEVPKPLIEQLDNGGRLIVPLGDEFQILTLFRKIDDVLHKEEVIPVRFVPMKGIIEEN